MNANVSENVIIFKPPYVELVFPKNSGTPKSSISIRFSIINHPFWVPLFLETPNYITQKPFGWTPGLSLHLLGLAANCPQRNTPKSDTSPSTKILSITVRSAPEKKKLETITGFFLGEFSRYKRPPQLTPLLLAAENDHHLSQIPNCHVWPFFFFPAKKTQSKYTI